MYRYNTSFSVEQGYISQWMDYMQKTYIPKIQAYEAFTNGTLLRVDAAPQQGYRMFAFQVEVEKLIHIKKWQRQLQKDIEQEIRTLFDDKVLFFSSILEEIPMNK